MKIGVFGQRSIRQRQDGFATVIMIVILAILLIYFMGNARTLHLLGCDLRLVEIQQQSRVQRQSSRLVEALRASAFTSPTNAPGLSAPTNSPPR